MKNKKAINICNHSRSWVSLDSCQCLNKKKLPADIVIIVFCILIILLENSDKNLNILIDAIILYLSKPFKVNEW